MHLSTKTRARRAQEIVAKYYEEGNQSKCLKAIWRRYIEAHLTMWPPLVFFNI